MERHSLEETPFLRWLKKILLVVETHPSLWIFEVVFLVLIAFISTEDIKGLILALTSIYIFFSLVSNLMYQYLVSKVSDGSVLRGIIYFLLVFLVASLASCFLGWILSPVVVDYSKLSSKQAEAQFIYLMIVLFFLNISVINQLSKMFSIVYTTRRLSVILLAPTVVLMITTIVLLFVSFHCFLRAHS